jgi:hypothetical protein
MFDLCKAVFHLDSILPQSGRQIKFADGKSSSVRHKTRVADSRARRVGQGVAMCQGRTLAKVEPHKLCVVLSIGSEAGQQTERMLALVFA